MSNENVQYEKKRFGKVVPTKGVDYFTNAEKEEMTEDVIEQVEEDLNFTETINGINNSISNLENNKVDKQQGKGLSTNDFTNQYKQQIDDNKANISTINQNLANYSLISETGSILQLNMNSTTYKISAVLKDKNGNTISTSNEIDLPLESVVVSGTYDSTNKKIVLVLENGNTIDVPVGDLINGLQSEITSQNKLDSDLVDDTNSSNKFVSSAEKQAWNNKAEASDIPTKMSELTNDDNFVKDANYVHTDNNYTSDEKNKLSGIESGSQKNVIEKISVNGIEQTIKADKSVDIRIDNRKKYTIKRQYANNTSSEWERMDDAVGLVANATHDGTSVTNDFDNIYPWSEIKKHIYNFDTKQVVAEYGDVNYIEDGSLGSVLSRIPEFYWKRWRDDTYEYISISEYPIEGYIKSEQFSVGSYMSSFKNNKLASFSGSIPEVSRTITSFREKSMELGDDVCQMDYHYHLLQILYLVEYADYNSQSKLGRGITGLRVNDNDKALVAENSTNRIIVSTTVGGYFDVGMNIGLGNNSAWNNNIASNREILSKESYSNNGITGIAITFSGSAVNITTNTVIHASPQKSGQCASLGNKSGCLTNDGKSAMFYRGIEIFGNAHEFIDGHNIKDHIVYISTDYKNYQVDKFDGSYKPLGYTNATANGFAKSLGYDENNPLYAFPTEVGASDSTGTCDYYNQSSGNRIAFAGGYCSNAYNAGLWCWDLAYTSSHTNIHIGSRLLRLG